MLEETYLSKNQNQKWKISTPLCFLFYAFFCW